MSMHAEWLSLIEISGAFLAEPILDQAFPQGLEGLETSKKQAFRQTYEEWREALDTGDELQAKLHQEWINWVLKTGLEWDEDDEGEELKAGANVPADLKLELLEHSLTLKPDYALFGSDANKPYLLVASYSANIELTEVVAGDGWSTTPAERMSHLCRATGTRLGLVTNGEQWMVVDAPEGGITSYASWYARLWSQEPVTLKAFFSLLNIRTVFSGFGLDAKNLTELLDDSLKHQDEVTETLGAQVQRAVEVLIQSIDRINNDANGELLKGVEPTELYEAGLTYMMRLVFLLCAEERGLLLLGDETYEANYAVSTLRMKLREEAGLHGEEVLSYRNNAWARLLAVFRAVYGGVEHEGMRMPALGGSLFDPDRFPFLEGRAKDSNWKIDEARPLPIDNRTVLLFLDAIQLYQGRTLSYRALDVEQIGYVYEGLLERTVIRSPDVTLELDSTKSAKKPWLLLGELESAKLDGTAAVNALLRERTGSSASRITNDLARETSEAESEKLLLACQNDAELRDRIKPYYHFLRVDAWTNPMIYTKGAYMVATGADRRETGTHYTPKSLTEAIVLETLEPIVYIGPSEGKERGDWQLKSPAQLLALKICDPAMGSGAFLVQVCRYLSERIGEAWALAEESGKTITSEGRVVDALSTQEPLPKDAEERQVIARRLVAENCLYGVDVNPLAVELAKLAIWLVTLSKGRPFGFLDHNLRHGDSLLGITELDQLHYLDMKPGKGSERKLFAQSIDAAIQEAVELRLKLRQQPILDIRDVEIMAHLDELSREKMELPVLVADALVGETLNAGGREVDVTMLSIEAGKAFEGETDSVEALRRIAEIGLDTDLPAGKHGRKALHWCLEFPEVFADDKHGFDAIVGNPPFLGGKKIAGVMGREYLNYLISIVGSGVKGSADLVAFFFLRSGSLVSSSMYIGLIASNSIGEGGTREVGLEQLKKRGFNIFRAESSEIWPGNANVVTSRVHLVNGLWSGDRNLNSRVVDYISPYLTDRDNWEPVKLEESRGLVFQGSVLLGSGFILDSDLASRFVEKNPDTSYVLKPYLSGQDVNRSPSHETERWVINFWDWSKSKAQKYSPVLFSILESKVILERSSMKSMGGAVETFWRHLWYRSDLYHLLGFEDCFEDHPKGWKKILNKPERVMVFATGATKYPCFTFVPNSYIYANTLCVVASQSFAMFAALSSDMHGIWAFEHGSRLHERLRYTHGDIFETFPFPIGVLTDSHDELAVLGELFFEQRAQYMKSHEKGMTKTYNDLHDSDIQSNEIKILRNMQIEINNAVLSSYGFEDIDLEHGFHVVGYLPEGKNVRFTISEVAREELLYRLALLNKDRHQAEQKELGVVTLPKKSTKYKITARDIELDKVAESKPQIDIFGQEE